MEEKIRTRHPDPTKQGTQISRHKYEQMRSAILEVLGSTDEMTFSALGEAVEERLTGKFDGSIGWYYTTVKLDLEARGLLERVDGRSPQRLRLVVAG